MGSPHSPRSLDVQTTEVDRYDNEAKAIMVDLKTAIEAGKPSKATIETIVGRLVGAMPLDLREEIQDMPAFKAELTQAIHNFCTRFEKNDPVETDFQNLVALLISIVVRHHVFSLANNRTLNTEQLPADFDPSIKPKYVADRIPLNAINTQKGLGLFVWIASFYTSWQGLTHYIGEYGIKAFTDVTGLKVAPNAAYWARTLSSIAISGWISQIVQRWKSDIEDRSHKGNISGPKAAWDSIQFRKKPILMTLAALAVVFDVGTNFNGAITAAGQRKEMTSQVAGAQGTIGERVAAIRDHMSQLDTIPTTVDTQVDTLLREEAGGNSETGADGTGPIYHTKAGLYTESGPSIAKLTGTEFKDQLKSALDGSGLIDGQTLVQEVDGKIDTSTAQVDGLLQEIEAKTAALDPMQEPEAVQQDLDAVVKKIEEALNILNEDLPDDLNSHMKRYDDFSKRMITIAQTLGGSDYKDLQPDKLKQWELPNLKMENEKIDIDEIHYVGFEDIYRVLKEQYTPAQGTILLVIAALFAYINSYADLHTLPWTRKAYNRDRAEAEEKKRRFIDQYEAKLCSVLLKALNEGPFSKFFNQKEKHHPMSVKEILEARMAELSTMRKDTRSSGWNWLPVGPGESEDWKGLTDVAQRHNARVRAVQQVMGSNVEIQGLLARLLPGLAVLETPKPGENKGTVIRLNDETIERRNAGIQARELDANALVMESNIDRLVRLGAKLSTEEWEQQKASYESAKTVLDDLSSKVYPANADLLTKVQGLSTQCNGLLVTELPNIVRRELNNLELKDATPDAALIVVETRINRLSTILGTIAPIDQDNARHITEANNVIGQTHVRIAEIRENRRRTQTEGDRMAEQRTVIDTAQKMIRSLDSWLNVRGTVNPRKTAEDLADALGERFLSLRSGTTLDNATAIRLRAAYQVAQDALTLLIHENIGLPKHEAMKTALRDDWMLLENYL